MKPLSYFIIFLAFSLCVLPIAQAVDIMPGMQGPGHLDNAPVNLVTGLVKDVQGDWCIVEDSQGGEWRIQVDQNTDTVGHVLQGVKIMARVASDGHAQEVTILRY